MKEIKTNTGKIIKLIAKDNKTFVDFGKKICKLPYGIDKTIKLLENLKII